MSLYSKELNLEFMVESPTYTKDVFRQKVIEHNFDWYAEKQRQDEKLDDWFDLAYTGYISFWIAKLKQ